MIETERSRLNLENSALFISHAVHIDDVPRGTARRQCTTVILTEVIHTAA